MHNPPIKWLYAIQSHYRNASLMGSTMKVCMVTACYPPSKGGVERSVEELVKQLRNRGHHVHVITSSRGLDPSKFYQEIRDGVEVTRYPETWFFFDCPVNPKIALQLLNINYDILHVHGVTPTISDLALILGKLKRKPVILTYHYSPVPDYGGGCGRFISAFYVKVIDWLIVKLSDRIVTATRSFAIGNPNLRDAIKKLSVIPWGVRLPNPNIVPNDRKAGSYFRVLFVGQLKKYKGIRYLLDALKILKRKELSLDMVIVGDGPERKTLEAYAKLLEVDAEFTGALTEPLLHGYYANSDVLVLPSISGREGFGIVILEAMSYGKPVIVSQIPGPKEIVKDGFNGILVMPKKAYDIAKAIERLITDPQLLKTLGTNAKKTAEKYSWNRVGDEYEEVYRQVIEKPIF